LPLSHEECTLFLGDLPCNVHESQVIALFAPYGHLESVVVKRDKLMQNALYGFVRFTYKNDATRARAALNGVELHGRRLRVGVAHENSTLFIGDLDGSVTQDDLIAAFACFGPLIEGETFVKQPAGKYGFVRFACCGDAERAKTEMNGKVIGTRPMRIGYGGSNFEKHCVHVQFNSHSVSSVTSQSVSHLFNEQFLQKVFAPFAAQVTPPTRIVGLSLPRQTDTRRLKGYAFIHYEENDSGEAAALLALQTLTGGFQTSVSSYADASQSSGATTVDVCAGSGAATVNDNTQLYLLAGIPVRYSYGKRQVFSRQKHANDNAAATAGAAIAAPNDVRASMHKRLSRGARGQSSSHLVGSVPFQVDSAPAAVDIDAREMLALQYQQVSLIQAQPHAQAQVRPQEPRPPMNHVRAPPLSALGDQPGRSTASAFISAMQTGQRDCQPQHQQPRDQRELADQYQSQRLHHLQRNLMVPSFGTQAATSLHPGVHWYVPMSVTVTAAPGAPGTVDHLRHCRHASVFPAQYVSVRRGWSANMAIPRAGAYVTTDVLQASHFTNNSMLQMQISYMQSQPAAGAVAATNRMLFPTPCQLTIPFAVVAPTPLETHAAASATISTLPGSMTSAAFHQHAVQLTRPPGLTVNPIAGIDVRGQPAAPAKPLVYFAPV